MATTNRERLDRMLDLLRQGLQPFVQREMESEYGNAWLRQAAYSLRGELNEGDPHLDAHALLVLMWDQWNNLFNRTLGHAERSLVSELREVRNRWAHQRAISTDDTLRALDSAARLLAAVSAPEGREVERMRKELLRLAFEEETRSDRRRAAVAPLEGQPAQGLLGWREIVTPHPDVASGRYQQAEFVADLAAVHSGDATVGADYATPEEFFRRTYLTQGLRELLQNALLRMKGQGGDPVVELKTNFGGGKTHSMLALYHLFSGVPGDRLAGVDDLLDEMGLPAELPTVKRAVLVGFALSPGQTHEKPGGVATCTLWGELAWQLGGADGYAIVGEADRLGVSPGSDALRRLFTKYGPALILIDEWITYVRQLYGKDGMPGGSFEANLTFAQALTEAAKQVPNCLLVASLPSSQIEVGGSGGEAALARLESTFARVQRSWRPANAEESFEIVRRRLFQPIADAALFRARDAVIDRFVDMYRKQSGDFPAEAQQPQYRQRMQAAYPIHPELFDRLYGDWSALEKFQRTRGVLRLMANVIQVLWERSDAGLLILPASVPIDDPKVQAELTHYLEDNWVPIIGRDVDGAASLPMQLDRANPNLGRYSAARRVARAIYMGSAPLAHAARRSIDERSIRLGCVQPGEQSAVFGDALRRLSDQSTHLYSGEGRYWYSTQPSVLRMAQERAAAIDEAEVWEELRRRLRGSRERGEFAAVHAMPASSAEVPDEATARLVILPPEASYTRNDPGVGAAQQQARMILDSRGNGPRLHRNMLVFLAPDAKRLPELEQGIRTYLAWKSIHEQAGAEGLNLDAAQAAQARTKLEEAGGTVESRIRETYSWVLAPAQSDPRDPGSLHLTAHRLGGGTDAPAVQAARKLISDEAFVTRYGATRLRMALDTHNLWAEGDRVSVRKLWEYFSSYPYLERLRDERVLLDAVGEGPASMAWDTETFAVADAWDEAAGRYRGLKVGERTHGHPALLLVKPEAALRQLEAERRAAAEAQSAAAGRDGGGESSGQRDGGTARGPAPTPGPAAPAPLRHYHGAVKLDPLSLASQASRIAEAIVQHLSGLPGAEVEITLEISAHLPGGATEQVLRTVSENARTLRFWPNEFEQ